MERREPTLVSIFGWIIFIIFFFVVLKLLIVDVFHWELPNPCAPKPIPMVEKFNEAKWMKGAVYIPDGWVYSGSSILKPQNSGEMGILIKKYKTAEGENVLLYQSFRLEREGVFLIQRMAMTIFCTPPFKHAVYHKGKCDEKGKCERGKWEEVEHFEFGVDAIPHDRPWIGIILSMKAK